MIESLRATPRGKLASYLLAALLLLIAGTLRFAYYDREATQVDEEITTAVVAHLRTGDWDTNWAKAELSPGFRYDQYNFSSHLYATYAFYGLVKLLPGTAHWLAERDGLLVYRFFVALLACLVVAQTIHLGHRLGGWSVALGAGLLTALNPLLVQDAHYVRPEPFVTVLTLAAVALSWPRDTFRLWRPLAAAFCIGLLVACKVSMLGLLWLPLIPFIVAPRSASVSRIRLLALATTIPAAAFLGFAVGAPGALAHPAQFWTGIQHLTAQYSGIHPPQSHNEPVPVADMMGRYFLATLGVGSLLFFALGTAALLRARRWPEAALLLGPIAFFGLYFATRTVFFERNVSHIVPLFCLLAAFGVTACVSLLSRWSPTARSGLLTAALLALSFLPASIAVPLVFTEFSGGGLARDHAFEEAVKAAHPEAAWHGELYFIPGDGPINDVATRVRTTGQSVLLRVTDYRNDRSAAQLADLAQRLHLDPVARNDGTFPSLPLCTLISYHSPTYRYFLAK